MLASTARGEVTPEEGTPQGPLEVTSDAQTEGEAEVHQGGLLLAGEEEEGLLAVVEGGEGEQGGQEDQTHQVQHSN